MFKKSCVELSVQLAVLLVIWRIKNLQPTAMKKLCELEMQINTLCIVDTRNSLTCVVLETCRMVLNTL